MSVNKKPKKKSSPAPVHSQVALLGGSYSLIISAVVLALLWSTCLCPRCPPR